VVVLVIDGVRTDEITRETTSELTGVTGPEWAPRIWSDVAPDATVIRALRNTGVTITAPAHAAMLVGNNLNYGNFPSSEGAGLYRPPLPTLFEESGVRSALVSNTPLIVGLEESDYPDDRSGAVWTYIEDDGPLVPDDEVTAGVQEAIDNGSHLVVANLHSADAAGHEQAEGMYENRVVDADADAADLYAWIGANHPEVAANLLFVVVADHGRHRTGGDDYWRNHGDACDGCREVPFFLAGPAAARTELSGDYRLLDLTPTIAGFLGAEAPWADGLPLTEALPGVAMPERSGEVDIAASGTIDATQLWLSSREERSQVVVGGVTLSGGGMGAEAPAVLDGTHPFACFRELFDEGDVLPWRPRCFTEEDDWSEVGFPDEEVGSAFRPVLLERRDRVWAGWIQNVSGATDGRLDVGLALASWGEDGWGKKTLVDAWFPTTPTLTSTDSGLVAAYETSDNEMRMRYTRRVRVAAFNVNDGAAEVITTQDFDLASVLGEDARVALPALTATGDAVTLAMVAITASGTAIYTTSSADGGLTWGDRAALPDGGPILVHLAPVWDGSNLVWGVLDEGEAKLCRATPGATEADCRDVGSPRLQSFVVEDGVATVIRDAGSGEWERATVAW
jgi:hypothetical protein